MNKQSRASSIPALFNEIRRWILYDEDKANLLADTFISKFGLPSPIWNEYTFSRPLHVATGFRAIRVRTTSQELYALDENSGTGPDNIAAIVLKRCR